MNVKRILSCVLALALAASLLPGLVSAPAAASFSDIADDATAENVEVLRMLGVVDGVGNGAFRPGGTLTRAQFCKMAVVMQGKEGAAGQYQTYTIFPDVRASHWAAGYVNLAVRGEEKLLSGYPDGKFHPDEEITFGQTVTILMRMLGYSDSDVGAVWPQGYLNTAAEKGLTEGVSLAAGDKVTRAQAARLFCNLLRTERKDGGLYAEKRGTLKQGTVLLSVSATAADGTKGAVQTEDGIYKTAGEKADATLAGRRGALLLDANGRVLTFLPDRGGSRQTVTVSEFAQDGLTDSTGRRHAVRSAVTTYYRGEKRTYGEAQPDLRPGMAATLYFTAAGELDYLFISGSVAADAVVVSRQGSTAGFERLTDSTNYQIYKNGAPATAADLQEYDVATYDAATNTIRISDVRLTGYYADAVPNPNSPQTMTVLGHDFPVLPCAAESAADFRIGQQVTLLLTEDHQIAGVVDPKKVRGNAVGIVTSVSANAATVELLCGLTIKGDPKLNENTAGQYEGQLVRVTSYQKGDQISLSRVTSGGVRGALDTAARRVGDTPLAANVRIYDKVGSGPLVSVQLSDISRPQVPAGDIVYAGKDSSGKVDVLVLDNVTGDGYLYGRYVFTPAQTTEDGEFLANARIKIAYGTKRGEVLYSAEAECGGGYRNGDFGGLAFYKSQSGTRLAGTAAMTKLSTVPNTAWNGGKSVTWKGVTYPVAENAVCYNRTTDSWMTVAEGRAFANTADLYYDNAGQKIRIVVVQQAK